MKHFTWSSHHKSGGRATEPLEVKNFVEDLQKSFPSLKTHFKHFIFKYKDTLRAFLEMEMDKITYFKPLNMITKQELLFNMER